MRKTDTVHPTTEDLADEQANWRHDPVLREELIYQYWVNKNAKLSKDFVKNYEYRIVNRDHVLREQTRDILEKRIPPDDPWWDEKAVEIVRRPRKMVLNRSRKSVQLLYLNPIS